MARIPASPREEEKPWTSWPQRRNRSRKERRNSIETTLWMSPERASRPSAHRALYARAGKYATTESPLEVRGTAARPRRPRCPPAGAGLPPRGSRRPGGENPQVGSTAPRRSPASPKALLSVCAALCGPRGFGLVWGGGVGKWCSLKLCLVLSFLCERLQGLNTMPVQLPCPARRAKKDVWLLATPHPLPTPTFHNWAASSSAQEGTISSFENDR